MAKVDLPPWIWLLAGVKCVFSVFHTIHRAGRVAGALGDPLLCDGPAIGLPQPVGLDVVTRRQIGC